MDPFERDATVPRRVEVGDAHEPQPTAETLGDHGRVALQHANDPGPDGSEAQEADADRVRRHELQTPA